MKKRDAAGKNDASRLLKESSKGKPSMNLQSDTIVSTKYKLLLLFLSLAGTCIILFITISNGAGISPDSVSYIATARHFAAGNGFLTYDSSPLLAQPPMYPAILGSIDFLLGIDPLLSANFVGAIFFGLILYLSGLVFLKNLSPLLAFLGTASLLVSIPLVSVSFMAWSEPTFIFFVVLSLFSFSIYVQKKNASSLLLFSFSAALACLTRYIGVILVFTGFIGILIVRHPHLKTKLLHAFTFAIISLLPISIWVGRNYLLSGTLFGPRSSSLHSLSENLSLTMEVISRWFLPGRIINSRPALMLLSLAIGFLSGIIFIWAKTPLLKLLRQIRPLVVFALLYIFGYAGFLIISSSTTYYDTINNRLLSPITVPTTFLVFLIIQEFSKKIKEHCPSKPVEMFVAIAIVFWLIYPARAIAINTIHQIKESSNYGSPLWKNSETIQYIRENNLSNCTLYSNGDEAIYFFLNTTSKPIPTKSSGADTIANLSSLENHFPPEDKACVVWFSNLSNRSFLFTPDELLSVTHLEQTIQLNDGTIYVISKK